MKKKYKDLAFFRLCDTMGVEGGDGIKVNDLSAIMDGHIKDKYPVITYSWSLNNLRVYITSQFLELEAQR